MEKEYDSKPVFSGNVSFGDETEDAPEEEPKLAQYLTQLQQQNEILGESLRQVQEESATLRDLYNNTNTELTSLKKPALLVADVSTIKGDRAVIRLTNGNKFYSYVTKDARHIKSGDSVLVDQKTLNILQKIELNDSYDVEKFIILDKPKENWQNIGGLSNEIQEVKEVIELPLKSPELFEKVGIKPPKGILLYGPPGTGKTLLAKAAANSTNATFIEIVGSELVQKFIGEGAKLVKEIFELAKQKAPTIIFIDEIDAVASVRMENGTSGEREVNRTFMQLLAELDGFKPLDTVKVIAATNRIDILDNAIIRPGRLDRLIEVGLPNEEGRAEIFKLHSKEMNLKGVQPKEVAKLMENFSGAEIMAACTEAGYFAIRDGRSFVTQDDFEQAIDKVRVEEEDTEYKKTFG